MPRSGGPVDRDLAVSSHASTLGAMTDGPISRRLLTRVLDEFDSGARNRGAGYFRRGFATVVSSDGTELVGNCRNDRGQVYSCTLILDPREPYAQCSCPVGAFCKHCVAVLLTAADQAPARRSQRSMNDWRTLISELSTPAQPLPPDVTPPRPVALMFTVESSHSGDVVSVRPATTGKTGRWVTSRLTWQHLLYSRPDDVHDPAHLELLRRIASALRNATGFSPYTVDTLSLATASSDFWELLREATEAGIDLVTATGRGQPSTVDLTDGFSTGLHVMRGESGVHVGVQVLLGGEVIAPQRLWRTGRPRTTGITTVQAGEDGDTLLLGPVAPLSPTEERLLAGNTTLVVPLDQIDDFSQSLPALTAARRVAVDDGAIVPQVITGPVLVLQIAVDDDFTSTLRWLVEYTVDGEPRSFDVADPIGMARFRSAAAEAELWDAAREDLTVVTVDVFPIWQRTVRDLLRDRIDRPEPSDDTGALISALNRISLSEDPNETVEAGPVSLLAIALTLPAIDTAMLIDLVIPEVRARGAVEVRILGDAEFTLAESAPVVRFAGSVDDSTDWFDLTVSIDVDGHLIPLADLVAALTLGQEYMVLPDGTYFPLDVPELDELTELLAEARELGELVGDRVAGGTVNVTLWEELLSLGVVDDQLRDWQDRLTRLSQARPPQPVGPPGGLQATLRPYQQDGLDWLSFLWDNGLGGILADDMGLGKTVQTLALIARAVEQDPQARFLVVAPTSVVGNWATEAARFVPGLDVVAVGSTAKRSRKSLGTVIGDAQIVVTSYALLRIDYDSYAGIAWAGAIFDEGQFLKNHNSQVHQAARRLPASFKLAITGTPMENRIMELWSLVSITAPGLFSSPKRFKEHFAGPIERGHAPERLHVLRRRLKPIMLRRTKDQVLTELPAKQEQVVDLVLEPTHRKIYDTFLAHERQQLLGLLDDFDNNRIQVLRALTRLRQLSLHPGLVDEAHDEVKSAKIAYLAEQLPVLIDEGHSVLIFSSFTGFLTRLAGTLDGADIPYSYLDGSMSAAKRTTQIEEFTAGQTGVFLISLKAGGFGLNLTTADYCFMADPWWNPAAESQAVDRAHRIGQQRPVTVYRMVSAGTIEEKVIGLQNRKRELFAALIDDGAQFSGAITADDVRALLE